MVAVSVSLYSDFGDKSMFTIQQIEALVKVQADYHRDLAKIKVPRVKLGTQIKANLDKLASESEVSR